MTEVVRQTDRLDQILVGAKGTRERPPDLGDFQSMGETGAEVIAFVINEDLGLVLESTERRGMDDAVAVTLKGCPVFGLAVQIGAPLGVLAAHPVGGKAPVLILLK